ncbi:deoxyribonuclease TATDN1 isoform X2 [Diorhabda sublineata]|uniref:deoxyribonuclease TATDN1 isoform X2 n=1 Tax=Diorhabda sublineata TaxID=1163346 RepID=UPI0024E08C98|nr:deoxyribonuclease TATDN1 isoform X2 [Diorhabda sublineata]
MSKLRKYIDIGANLTDTMYSGIYNGNKKHEPDLLQVLKRSWQSGLDKIIITGGNLEESRKALELAITSEHLYTTVGCHPTRCKEFEEHREGANSYLEKLKDIIITGGNKVVAVGECGLDYDRLNFCPKDIQLKYFNLQLSLTKTFNLPLFLHCRNAAEDLYAVLVNYPGVKGVVHSFDGSYEEAYQNLETVKLLPSNRILLETDCPWCEVRPSHAGYKFISKENLVMPTVKKEKWNPEQMVKSRNEPCNIRQILDIVASIRNANIDLLCEQVFDNTMELFFKKDNK